MVRNIKVKEIPGRCTHIRVEKSFDKNRGYIATMTPVILYPNSYQVIYDGEYFDKYRPTSVLLVSAKRRSAKKEEEAEYILSANALAYAIDYAMIANCRGADIQIVGREGTK